MTMPTYAQSFQIGSQAPRGIGPSLAGDDPRIDPAVASEEWAQALQDAGPAIISYGDLLSHYLERQPDWRAALSRQGGPLDWDHLLDHGPAPADPAELARWEGARHAHARSKAKAARPADHAATGGEPPASRAAERAALVRRVQSGGAREGDLLRYLELTGVGE